MALDKVPYSKINSNDQWNEIILADWLSVRLVMWRGWILRDNYCLGILKNSSSHSSSAASLTDARSLDHGT